MNSKNQYTGVLVILVLMLGCKIFHSKSYYTQEIFLYKELNQFKITGNGDWEVKNDIISCGTGEGFIVTNGSFDQFQLGAEFLADSQVNSGIFIGCKNEEINPTSCFEVNIWDNHPNQDYRTGSIVTKQKPIGIVNTIDHWSTIEIIAEEGWIQVWINKIKTADLQIDGHTLSPIYFQKFGEGRIQFKNITIVQLQK